jgi:tetratricopeptide (TPR) repeat protein
MNLSPLTNDITASIFVGREEALKTLKFLLLSQKKIINHQVVAITGCEGVGKSTLAIYFAQLHRDFFPDGIFVVSVDDKSPLNIALQFADYYGEVISPDTKRRKPGNILRKVFQTKRSLLIFDNIETNTIQEILPTKSDSFSAIITTYNRNLPPQLGINLSTNEIFLSPLSHTDSLTLVANFIDPSPDIEKIIHKVGGLPLALEIIGEKLSLDKQNNLQTLDSLNDENKILNFLEFKNKSLAISLQKILQQLDKQKKYETIDFFACLSLCNPDGFSIYEAKAVADCDKNEAEGRIDYLRRLSLINILPNTENKENQHRLFIFHPLVRLFAKQLLETKPNLKQQADYRYHNFLHPPTEANLKIENRYKFDRIDDVIQIALQLIKTNNLDSQFIRGFLDFCEKNAYYKDAIGIMSQFQNLADAYGDWAKYAEFAIQQAKYLALDGKAVKALEILDEIQDVFIDIEPSRVRQLTQATWWNQKGSIYQKRGLFKEAANAFEQSAQIDRQLGNKKGLAAALTSLGGVLNKIDEYDKAVKVLEQSIKIDEEFSNRLGLAKTYNVLGKAYECLKQLDKAKNAYQCCLEINQQLKNKSGEARVLHSLGSLYIKQNNLKAALDQIQTSISIGRSLKEKAHIGMALNTLGGLLDRLGRYEDSTTAWNESIRIRKEVDDELGLGMTYNSMGRALSRRGLFSEAALQLEQCFQIFEHRKQSHQLEILLPELVKILRRLGRYQDVTAYCDRALAVAPNNPTFIRLVKH